MFEKVIAGIRVRRFSCKVGLTWKPVRNYRLPMHVEDMKAKALDIFSASVEAVHPQQLMEEVMLLKGTVLHVSGLKGEELEIDLSEVGRIVAVGAGKAVAPMAGSLEELLQERLDGGLISVKYDHGFPLDRIELREAGHPIPDDNGIAATVEICDLLDDLEENDLAFVLLTGGGSALLDAYSEGITLDDAQLTNNILLNSGAPIQEINTVRKHISRVKGGQLARHALPARVIALVLSDVIGDPLPIIASGPTVPDPSTYGEALEILEHRNVINLIPDSVREHLESGASGKIAETLKEGEPGCERCSTFLIGNIDRAIREAVDRAGALGFNASVLTSTMDGEAGNIGKMMAGLLIENAITGELAEVPFCLIAGGETTVTIEGESGTGGRSQELALAAAVALQEIENVVLLAAGTDGTDGPTDAAGAVVDGKTVERGRLAGLDPLDYLSKHDSYSFHKAAGSLVRTGPTMTNVMDIVLLLADPGQQRGG